MALLRVLLSALAGFPLVAVQTALAQSIGLAEADDPLSGPRLAYRLLVVCEDGADPAEDPPLISAQYEALLDNPLGYGERNVLLVWIGSDYIMHWRLAETRANPERPTLLIGGSEEDKANLRARTGCKADTSSLALIGLDGGVKARWSKPLSNAELFARIDAMPMRVNELNAGTRRSN